MRELVPDSLGLDECMLALTCKDVPPMVVNSKQIAWMLKRREKRKREDDSPRKSGRSLHAKKRYETGERSGFTIKGKS
jgi:hypothetical protein